MPDDLYDKDFHLWTQAQAAALHACAGASNALDYEHLAAKVEDLGRAERNGAESHFRQIIAPVYEITATRPHRQVEILDHRIAIERVLIGRKS